ncbi:hypothetical protein MSG28_008799, partial [Choristoneura fumiferana]
GWGCGYRTLQTLCSWMNSNYHRNGSVPSIQAIQETLVELEDKPRDDLNTIVDTLKSHFEKFGSPIMMGGDVDCSSKGIMGIHVDHAGVSLLVVDPHYVGKEQTREFLQNKSWLQFVRLDGYDVHDGQFRNEHFGVRATQARVFDVPARALQV